MKTNIYPGEDISSFFLDAQEAFLALLVAIDSGTFACWGSLEASVRELTDILCSEDLDPERVPRTTLMELTSRLLAFQALSPLPANAPNRHPYLLQALRIAQSSIRHIHSQCPRLLDEMRELGWTIPSCMLPFKTDRHKMANTESPQQAQ